MARERSVFRSYTAEGFCTNFTANSLEDFTNKLDRIDSSAILFHYPRRDSQAWIKNVVGDHVLADPMCFIQRNISKRLLRKDLFKILNRRIDESGHKKIALSFYFSFKCRLH